MWSINIQFSANHLEVYKYISVFLVEFLDMNSLYFKISRIHNFHAYTFFEVLWL